MDVLQDSKVCLRCGRPCRADYCAKCWPIMESEAMPRNNENPELAAILDRYILPNYLEKNRSCTMLFIGRVREWKTTVAIRLGEMLKARNGYNVHYSINMRDMLNFQKPGYVNIQDDLDNYIADIDGKNRENIMLLKDYFNAFSKHNNLNISIVHYLNDVVGKLKNYYDVLMVAERTKYSFYHISRNYLASMSGRGKSIMPMKLLHAWKSELLYSPSELERIKKEYGIDDIKKDEAFNELWGKKKARDSDSAEQEQLFRNMLYGSD